MLDYSLLFMLFSFVAEGGSVCPGAMLDYVSRGWVGESRVVDDAHLFILEIQAALELVGREKLCHFSQCCMA
jgi:hypothetical protein